MENAKEILISKGITPSIHRLMILKYLSETRDHPNADQIYKALLEEIPTLSKTTVYNTLKAFVDVGIIGAFSIDNSELRYEYNHTPHAHFRCRKCHSIYDIEMTFDCLEKKKIDGHQIQGQHMILTGICSECLKREDNNA